MHNQSYREIEIIIVDDGSTDLTKQVIQEMSASDDRIFSFFKPVGAPVARSQAITMARGGFVTGLDDDDYFDPASFVEYWAILQKSGISVHSSTPRGTSSSGSSTS